MNIADVSRIRGKVFQFAEPKEWLDLWGFEVSVWSFDGEKQAGKPIGPFGPYETKEMALAELKRAAQIAAEACEKGLGMEPSGKFMDMKAGGVIRPWRDNA